MMEIKTPLRADLSTFVIATVPLVLVKVLLSLQLELTSVESYLWMCAQHPALGYYDYPGMAAWMIAASEFVFGSSTAGIRALFIAAGAGSAWFVYLAARRLYGERAGVVSLLLAAGLPLLFVYGSYATPDSPLILFWTAALWALVHALSGDSPRWWLPAGLFTGLAMDSKYTAIFLPLGVLGFLLASPDHRGWLRRKEPYLAALVALVAFSPTLVWNALHGWQSLLYQGVERFGERPFRAKELLTFPLSQLLLVTPFVCLWAWGCGLRTFFRWRSEPWPSRFLAATGVPVLLFFAAVLFTRTVRGHWPAPGYASLVILSSAAVLSGGLWGRRFYYGTTLVLLTGILLVTGAISIFPKPWRSGWSQLAGEVEKRSPDFIIGREYHLASQLGYHLQPIPAVEFTALGRPSKAFPHWWKAWDFAGRDAIVVTEEKHYAEERELVARAFERVDDPVRVAVTRFGGRKEEFLLVRARGYRPAAIGFGAGTGPGGSGPGGGDCPRR